MKTNQFLDDIKKTLAKLMPEGGKAYLFGSRARGDNRPDSDWDVLILLDKEQMTESDYERIAFPLFDLGLDNDTIISPKIYTKNDWERRSFTPFYKNVLQDRRILV